MYSSSVYIYIYGNTGNLLPYSQVYPPRMLALCLPDLFRVVGVSVNRLPGTHSFVCLLFAVVTHCISCLRKVSFLYCLSCCCCCCCCCRCCCCCCCCRCCCYCCCCCCCCCLCFVFVNTLPRSIGTLRLFIFIHLPQIWGCSGRQILLADVNVVLGGRGWVPLGW